MKWISTSTRSTPSSTVRWSVPFWKRKRALAVYPGICQRWFKSVKITVHTKWYSGQRSKDVRSLDSKRLWEEHGLRSKQHHWDLPPLPPWLWSCWLLVFKHLRSVQVHKNCFNKILNSSVDELSSFFAEFERSPKMTWFDFISSFGGFCGLCLGISFVSVVEILYWFSVRLCKNFWSNIFVRLSVLN